jgi:hypothetical protein
VVIVVTPPLMSHLSHYCFALLSILNKSWFNLESAFIYKKKKESTFSKSNQLNETHILVLQQCLEPFSLFKNKEKQDGPNKDKAV